MMCWRYRTHAGVFKICPIRAGHYGLYFNGRFLGVYDLPETAIKDVHLGWTGCDEWDKSVVLYSVPVYELHWEKVRGEWAREAHA